MRASWVRITAGWITWISGVSHCVLLTTIFVFINKYGGMAGHGKIDNGRYFLGQHGGFTEVPQNVYMFSLWNVKILIINLFVLAISGGAFWWLNRSMKQENK